MKTENLPETTRPIRPPARNVNAPKPPEPSESSAEDVVFSCSPARRPQPRVADPLLQWASGLQTKERTIYAGWLIEAGKDEALDGAMQQAASPLWPSSTAAATS
jgi:hypothetical protein